MKLKDYISNLFNFRVKNGPEGWDDLANQLGPSGVWSISGSPRKFQDIILEILKRVEALENERDNKTI